MAAGAIVIAFAATALTDSGVGSARARGQGWDLGASFRVLTHDDGPDVTTNVVERTEDGMRGLLIDGFLASAQEREAAHYMTWMGRLPMLLAADPQRALVICFGTGQTAHGVLDEGVGRLDVVDINPAVFAHADLFEMNHGVLKDARTRSIVMDGRAWLRRTDAQYDVVTLEPMPPTFAGVNALYSREFYEIASGRMRDGGIIAQWLPYHLVTLEDASAIAAAFQEVFPDSILWLDPLSTAGILLGRKGDAAVPLGEEWPGFARRPIERILGEREIRAAVKLSPASLARYVAGGTPVTDDNQALSYGSAGAAGTSPEMMAAHEQRVELAAAAPP